MGKHFSAQNYYRNINEANLTGAVDVIVIKKEDGTYESTPFYVRFGKMGILYPSAQMVEIYINGQLITDLCMRVGSTGFAYFDDSPVINSFFHESHNSSSVSWKSDHEEKLINSDGHQNDHLDDVFELDMNENDSCDYDKPVSYYHNDQLKTDCQTDILMQSNIKQENICLGDFINYLQNLNQWPNEFYIYQLEARTTQLAGKQSPTVDANDTAKCTKPNKLSNMRCHLLFPEVFLKLSQNDDTLDHLWIVWSGMCCSGPTAAYCLLNSVREDERKRLCEVDAKNPTSQIVMTQYVSDQRLDANPANPNDVSHCESKCRWFWWRSTKTESNLNAQPTTPEPLCIKSVENSDLDANESQVQPLRAPIYLGIASPSLSQYEYEQEQETSRTYLNECTTLGVPIPTASHYSSANELRSEPSNQDSQQKSSSEEAGYFSDETDCVNTNNFLKRSKQPKENITIGENILTSDRLQKLNLHKGVNEAVFCVVSKYQGTCQCACFIYLWNRSDKVVISDIDGTITKSDWLGQIMPLVGMDWTHQHIARLYHQIASNGYRFIYLSSRPIGQARPTRKLLHNIQQDNYRLPDGPILLSPFSLFKAFHKEVILRRADEYKIQCLQTVRDLFICPNQPFDDQPFVAGFGNRPTDVKTYKAVGLQGHQIFTIDYMGDVVCGDSVDHFVKPSKSKVEDQSQLNDITDSKLQQGTIVTRLNLDSMLQMTDACFPRIKNRVLYASDYSDFTYWRT